MLEAAKHAKTAAERRAIREKLAEERRLQSEAEAYERERVAKAKAYEANLLLQEKLENEMERTKYEDQARWEEEVKQRRLKLLAAKRAEEEKQTARKEMADQHLARQTAWKEIEPLVKTTKLGQVHL